MVRLACKAVQERCAELANNMRMLDDPMPAEDVADARVDPEAWCRATAKFTAGKIADAIRGLDL
jgi:hypothetical protein